MRDFQATDYSTEYVKVWVDTQKENETRFALNKRVAYHSDK